MQKNYHYKLLTSYDGTKYGGWQVQPNATSIQWVIQNALQTITGNKIQLIGSGRTDAGVHALEHVSHFSIEKPLDLYRLTYGLNCVLPQDIRILSMEETSADFHARYSAKGKIYHYHLSFGPIFNPFQRLYTVHFYSYWDAEKVKKAIPHFIGTHDFTSFANDASQGSASRDPIRTLFRLDMIEEENSVRLEFEGDGFLYKMVRNIVGTLIDVGFGNIPAETIPDLFSAKTRSHKGRAAPPHGLFLVKVLY